MRCAVLCRDQLVVRNGGKTAMKVSIAKRPEIESFFEFTPDFAFVQVGEGGGVEELGAERRWLVGGAQAGQGGDDLLGQPSGQARRWRGRGASGDGVGTVLPGPG